MNARTFLFAAIALALAAPMALARPGGGRGDGAYRPHNQYIERNRQPIFTAQRQMPPPGYGRRMGEDDRQKMRDDLRWANREPQREEPPRRAEPGRLTPEEREKLRRDILDANRDMPRDISRDARRDRGRR
jgi:hypothetical protein